MAAVVVVHRRRPRQPHVHISVDLSTPSHNSPCKSHILFSWTQHDLFRVFFFSLREIVFGIFGFLKIKFCSFYFDSSRRVQYVCVAVIGIFSVLPVFPLLLQIWTPPPPPPVYLPNVIVWVGGLVAGEFWRGNERTCGVVLVGPFTI
jgi:hypothetical protein